MRVAHVWDDKRKAEEAEKIKPLTDAELVDYIASAVNGAAVLSSRGYGFCTFDQQCDVGYDEAARRGKSELYGQAHDRVKRSYGFA